MIPSGTTPHRRAGIQCRRVKSVREHLYSYVFYGYLKKTLCSVLPLLIFLSNYVPSLAGTAWGTPLYHIRRSAGEEGEMWKG